MISREETAKEKNGKRIERHNGTTATTTHHYTPRETKLCMYGGRGWETWIFASRSHTKRYNGSFQSKRIAFLQPWASKRETPFGNFGRVES